MAKNGSSASHARDEIRAKIFSGKNIRKEFLTLFGAEIELRQPSLGEMLDFQQMPDRKYAIAGMLIAYSFVPGTNEKVFEDTDVESILTLPFGPEMVEVSNAITRLTSVEVQVQEAKESLQPTSGG